MIGRLASHILEVLGHLLHRTPQLQHWSHYLHTVAPSRYQVEGDEDLTPCCERRPCRGGTKQYSKPESRHPENVATLIICELTFLGLFEHCYVVGRLVVRTIMAHMVATIYTTSMTLQFINSANMHNVRRYHLVDKSPVDCSTC